MTPFETRVSKCYYRSGDAFYNMDGQVMAYLADGQWHDNTDHKGLADCAARFSDKDLPFGGFPIQQAADARILDLICEG